MNEAPQRRGRSQTRNRANFGLALGTLQLLGEIVEAASRRRCHLCKLCSTIAAALEERQFGASARHSSMIETTYWNLSIGVHANPLMLEELGWRCSSARILLEAREEEVPKLLAM